MIGFNFVTEKFEEMYGIPDWLILKWWIYATYESRNENLSDRLRRYADF